MPVISHRKLSGRDFRCIYNTNRFTDPEINDLLSRNAEKLFVRAQEVCETGNALSYQLTIANRHYFAKKLKPRSWRHVLRDRILSPQAYRNFAAAGKLLNASIRTPPPILAAVVKSSSGTVRQVLVTDWLEEALELDQFVRKHPNNLRTTFIPELADLLSDLHAKGFCLRHLRSANILIQTQKGKHVYSFIDLDRLVHSRLLRQSSYVSTVSRACADLYPYVPEKDRRFLLVSCFDYALKRNIYTKPSEQQGFVDIVLDQIKARNSQVD